MTRVSEDAILEALRRVVDSDTGRDIVGQNMVSGLVIKEGNVGFALEVDPARGPKLEPLRKAAEQVVMALDGVTSVTAVLTAQKPGGGSPQPTQPSAGASRPPQQQGKMPNRPEIPGIKSIIAARIRQGRGREIDCRRQSGTRAQSARPGRRPDGRGCLRALIAENDGDQRQADL